jgi:hypothetical protein
MRILFLTKPVDFRSEKAVEFFKSAAEVQVTSGPWAGDECSVHSVVDLKCLAFPAAEITILQ